MFRRTLICLLPLVFLAACGDSRAADPSIPCEAAPAASAEEAALLYFDAWNDPSPSERRCSIEASVAPSVVRMSGSGLQEGMSTVVRRLEVEAAELVRTGLTRELRGSITFRHQEALIEWVVVDSSGEPVDEGQDWLELAWDGRIARIHTFAGRGENAPVTNELAAWEEAWNLRDANAQLDAMRVAATDDVRFTDLLTDIEGAEALVAEIRRQQEGLGGNLELGETLEVFETEDGLPRLARQDVQIVLAGGGAIQIVNFIRFREGRIERLAGFPTL